MSQHIGQQGGFLLINSLNDRHMRVPARDCTYIRPYRQVTPHRLADPDGLSSLDIMEQLLFHNRRIHHPPALCMAQVSAPGAPWYR